MKVLNTEQVSQVSGGFYSGWTLTGGGGFYSNSNKYGISLQASNYNFGGGFSASNNNGFRTRSLNTTYNFGQTQNSTFTVGFGRERQSFGGQSRYGSSYLLGWNARF